MPLPPAKERLNDSTLYHMTIEIQLLIVDVNYPTMKIHIHYNPGGALASLIPHDDTPRRLLEHCFPIT
jgi:hypothetical protein